MGETLFIAQPSSLTGSTMIYHNIPTFQDDTKLLPHTSSDVLPCAAEKKPAQSFMQLWAVSFSLSTFSISQFVECLKVRVSLCRHCVECQHFKRGQYMDDNSCNRICKDEIRVVDKLGENTLTSSPDCCLKFSNSPLISCCLSSEHNAPHKSF